MPETKPASPLRTWTLMLAVLTIGLIALLAWYHQNTQARLDAHQAEIRTKGEALAASQAAHANLQEKLTAAIDQHKARESALSGDLDQAAKAQEALKAQAQAQQADHAANLASLRAQSEATQTELQQQLQAAGQEIETLKGEIAKLHQAATQAATDHEAHILQVTEDLTAEVVKYRTLLVGSEPERAALLQTWEQRVQTALGELIAARQTIEVERANLTTLDQTLTQTKQKNEELKQALSAATVKIQTTESALAEEREALANLRQEHETALTTADDNLKAAAARLEEAFATHSAQKGETEALIAQLQQQIEANATAHAAENQDAEARIAELQQLREADAATLAARTTEKDEALALIAQLKQEHEALTATHDAHKQEAADQIAQLNQQHEASEAALADLRGEHETLRGTLEQTQMAHAGAQSELERLSQEASQTKAALAEELAAAQTRISALTTELDEQGRQAEAALAKAKEALAQAEAQGQQSAAEGEAQRKNLVTELAQAKAELDKQRKQATEELAAARANANKGQQHQRQVWTRLIALGGQPTDQGILLALAEKEVRFPPGKAVLPAGEIPSLDGIAAALVAFPDLKVRIEGHTDSSGRDETNLSLSQARAEAVMAALVARGVAADRLTAVGLGKERPIASNNTAAGRAQNRRVELYVLAP